MERSNDHKNVAEETKDSLVSNYEEVVNNMEAIQL